MHMTILTTHLEENTNGNSNVEKELILSHLKEIIKTTHRLDESNWSMEARIVEDLNLDSVRLLEIFSIVSQKYELEFGEELSDSLLNLVTVGDLVNLILKNKKA